MSEFTSRILEMAIAIQQIPAPTFHEQRRAEFIRDRFLAEDLSNVEMDAVGNVYARLSPLLRQIPRASYPILVSAHLDTVFPESVELAVTREADRVRGPGIGDNAISLAGLLGLVWLLRQRNTLPEGDLWLVADVCEEGLGDLRGMKAIIERFGEKPGAYIVLEGMALGHIYHRALGVRRYRITVRTSGGHSWVDAGNPSAIHELTRLASRLTALDLPKFPRSTLNVGKISGGVSVNTIAPEAALELDLRSESAGTLLETARQVEELAHGMESNGVTVEVEMVGERPAGEIPASHPLVALAQECYRAKGMTSKLNIGSTDANIPLSRGLPAITVGLTTGGGAHTLHEYINLEPLEKGMEALAGLLSAGFTLG